jgi:FkbM family methyltransferase
MVGDWTQYGIKFQGNLIALVGRTHVKHDAAIIGMVFGERMFDASSFPLYPALLKYLGLCQSVSSRPLLIDAGANIGAASRYFNEVYQNIKILAVEPDPENASLSAANLKMTDAEIITAALSSEDGTLFINDVDFEPIGYRVGRTGNKEVPALSIPTILTKFSEGTFPFVIKIDIEGGEADVFEKNVGWLDQFPLVIIELHDWMLPGEGCSRNFFNSICKFDFDVLVRGENTFCFNNRLLRSLMIV